MKKLLLPFEGKRFPRELLNFVGVIRPKMPVTLTAAFVQETDYATMSHKCGAYEETGYPSCGKDEERMVRYNSRLLKQFCDENDIKYKIHADKEGFALPCLRKESRCADLLLLSSKHFFEDADQYQPNACTKEMIRHAECPVLLLPDNASLPGELILAYDGSAASFFAIRQFAYLFPELCHLQATLVFLNDGRADEIPEAAAIRELGTTHFKKFRMLNLRTKAADFYDIWLGMMNNPWLISGSFGRQAHAQLNFGGFSYEVIRRNLMPVFIAHK